MSVPSSTSRCSPSCSTWRRTAPSLVTATTAAPPASWTYRQAVFVDTPDPAPDSAKVSPLRRWTSTSRACCPGVEQPPGRPDRLAVPPDRSGQVVQRSTRQIGGSAIEQHAGSSGSDVEIVVIKSSTRGFFVFAGRTPVPRSCCDRVTPSRTKKSSGHFRLLDGWGRRVGQRAGGACPTKAALRGRRGSEVKGGRRPSRSDAKRP